MAHFQKVLPVELRFLLSRERNSGGGNRAVVADYLPAIAADADRAWPNFQDDVGIQPLCRRSRQRLGLVRSALFQRSPLPLFASGASRHRRFPI
jgi:hypothetical protein